MTYTTKQPWEPRYTAQSDDYAAEVMIAEGTGKGAFSVVVHDRKMTRLTIGSLPMIPTRYFDTFEEAKAWARSAAFRAWPRSARS